MNATTKSLLVAMAFGGSVATATASSVVTNVTASGPGLGSFSLEESPPSFSYLSSTYASVDPITLTFTVGHAEGGDREHHVYETIGNGTSAAFSNFHFHLDESASGPASNVTFNYFDAEDNIFAPELPPGFTLDSPSKAQAAPFEPTGPRDLNFTGELKAGAYIEEGYFSLNIPDPGAGNAYTFSLVQTPVAGVVPEPETYAMFLAGLGLMGFMARRKQNKNK
ncbi:PEP-CTERM protein-sorting domain-containing protein [Nitrosospira briensis]|uniref:PEP-CTERM protein-sorting domain-containing protein n=1 Tax=Nitrosospira briensis TaxID=35799 RepID=A0A1I5A7Z6_9PROT|nr:PEP-CTERM sorting domain-containing protein [Nitrosospira briensis]SFN58458.1 PEP-CTERM protein-sorting domain-containing protein [Nitrosospira briensis]